MPGDAGTKPAGSWRTLWSSPDTRKLLLHGLAEKGFGHDQLAEMQRIINAQKSDLFDVLAYVAYTLPQLNREERAARAKIAISATFNSKDQAFLNFGAARDIGQVFSGFQKYLYLQEGASIQR